MKKVISSWFMVHSKLVHGSWFIVHGKKKESMNYQPLTTNQLGFTLVEMLVTIAILALMGAVMTEVFVRTLRANNKAQVLSIMKQNGQTALETMDKIVRNATAIHCPNSSSQASILVVEKEAEDI